MDDRSTDDRLDRLMTRYLAERHDVILRDASPAAAVARRARPGPAGALAPVTLGLRPARHLAVALLVAVLLAALAAGAALVGARLLPSTDDPLAGLEAKEVAPGVHRVVRDGAGHDLASLGVIEIATGRDGAVWMNGHGGLFRLREPGIADPEASRSRTGLTVGPDGSAWWDGHWPSAWPDKPLRSFHGEGWVDHPGLPVQSFTVGPDGSVWGTRPGPSRLTQTPSRPGFELVRLDGDLWVEMDLTGWPDDLIANPGMYAPGLVATADGSLWVTAHMGSPEVPGEVLVRYDGSTWGVVPMPFDGYWIADGPDGSWVVVDLNVGEYDGETRIGRFADGTWSESLVRLPDATMYIDEDVVPPTVASDGAVWLRVELPGVGEVRVKKDYSERCDGVARVVGSTWTHHLPGTCIGDMAAGPHGEVWVATWDSETQLQRPGDVYVILPSASDT